jgi:outer membrane protein TolC
VEDGLSSLRVLSEQAEAEHRAVALSRRAVDIAVHEYEAGLQGYTTVATAQATELANEEAELQVASSRLVQSVALIKALGGGWEAATGDLDSTSHPARFRPGSRVGITSLAAARASAAVCAPPI